MKSVYTRLDITAIQLVIIVGRRGYVVTWMRSNMGIPPINQLTNVKTHPARLNQLRKKKPDEAKRPESSGLAGHDLPIPHAAVQANKHSKKNHPRQCLGPCHGPRIMDAISLPAQL